MGILVTKTLVIAGEGGGLFAAGPHSGGPILRAFDKRTGDILSEFESEFELPAHQTGVPMTYLRCGQQYIVVASNTSWLPSAPGTTRRSWWRSHFRR